MYCTFVFRSFSRLIFACLWVVGVVGWFNGVNRVSRLYVEAYLSLTKHA